MTASMPPCRRPAQVIYNVQCEISELRSGSFDAPRRDRGGAPKGPDLTSELSAPDADVSRADVNGLTNKQSLQGTGDGRRNRTLGIERWIVRRHRRRDDLEAGRDVPRRLAKLGDR